MVLMHVQFCVLPTKVEHTDIFKTTERERENKKKRQVLNLGGELAERSNSLVRSNSPQGTVERIAMQTF